MAGLVDNIFGITQRQYEQEKRQGLQDLAARLSSGNSNVKPETAMLGTTIGDYLGTKLGVALGGTDPRQEVMENKAKMEALNKSLENLAPDDSRRFYMLADAYQSAGDSTTASKYILQGQQMDALKEARGEANRVREESAANELADRMDVQDKYKTAADYSKNPTEENKARALEMGNAPSQLANLREASGAPMTKPERDRELAKMAQDFMHKNLLDAPDAYAKAVSLYDIIYPVDGATITPPVDTGDGGGEDPTAGMTPDQLEIYNLQNNIEGTGASVADDMEPGSVDKIMNYLGESYKAARGSGFKSSIEALQGISQNGITTTDHRDMYKTEPLPSSGMFMLQNPNQR